MYYKLQMPNLAQNQVLQIQADGLDFGVCTDLEPDLGFQAEIKPQIPRLTTTRKQKKNPTTGHCFDRQEYIWDK